MTKTDSDSDVDIPNPPKRKKQQKFQCKIVIIIRGSNSWSYSKLTNDVKKFHFKTSDLFIMELQTVI